VPVVASVVVTVVVPDAAPVVGSVVTAFVLTEVGGTSGLITAVAVPGVAPELPTATGGAPGSTVTAAAWAGVSAVDPLPLHPARDMTASKAAASNQRLLKLANFFISLSSFGLRPDFSYFFSLLCAPLA